jgi:integrase
VRGTLGLETERVHTIKPPDDWLDMLLLWLDYLRATGSAAGTVKLRSYQLRRFAAAHPEQLPLNVTLDTLTSWLATDGWSASTRHSAKSALRGFYGWAQLTGRIVDDPTRHLPRVRIPIGRPRPAGELTVRRAQRHESERVRLMVKLASIEGMRCIEICQVHTDDVVEDFVGYSLRVHGKGGKLRVIPLADDLAAEILHRERNYVFPGQVDGHLSAGYVSKLLSRALPDGVTAHMLRHRAAGRFYEGSGWDLRATQELLGHSSVATTQIYTPARSDQMRRGMLAAAG